MKFFGSEFLKCSKPVALNPSKRFLMSAFVGLRQRYAMDEGAVVAAAEAVVRRAAGVLDR